MDAILSHRITFLVLCLMCSLSVTANDDLVTSTDTPTDSLLLDISTQIVPELVTNSTRIEYRVFLVKESVKEVNDAILDTISDDEFHNEQSQNEKNKRESHSSTSTQIYIIAVIGVAPAAIGALVWWIKRKCHRGKSEDETRDEIYKRNQKLMNNSNGINDVEMGQITYRIVERAEKLNDSRALWYNNYRQSEFVKSRRVYSLEIPRKNLEMIEVLGEGNFGQVWKAKAIHLSETNGTSLIVAVKTNKIDSNEKDSEDLLKELDIMLQLGTHPNVVHLLGCCTENEPYFLIMEYVSMGKLLSYLRNHRADRTYYNSNSSSSSSSSPSSSSSATDEVAKSLSSRDLIMFAYQIGKGMEFISSHGIIHRDIAARNILINGNKTCKVADFGLSRSIRDKECDMYEQRTKGEMPIRWMSPESLSLGLFSSKSDVWAYAILMWEIMTLGSTPYTGMSAHEVIKSVGEGYIMEHPNHCDKELYNLMKLCWTMNPNNRLSFTEVRMKLSKMIELQCGYVDLEHFNPNAYYNIYSSPGEKV